MKQAVKAALKDRADHDGTMSTESLERLHKAEADLYYVVKFPVDQKYISLYPTSDANDAETTRARQEFLDVLLQNIKNGELPGGLHKRKPESKAYFEVERIRKSGEVYNSQQGQEEGHDGEAHAPEIEEKEGGDEFFA